MPVEYHERTCNQTGKEREIEDYRFARLTSFAHFMNKGICGTCAETAVQSYKGGDDSKPSGRLNDEK